MANEFDVTIKSLIDASVSNFFFFLSGIYGEACKVLAPLSEEYQLPTGKTFRRVDCLVHMADNRVIHVELQTKNESILPWRMLEYYALIFNRLPTYVDNIGSNFEQWLIFVGDEGIGAKDEIRHDRLGFAYNCCRLEGMFDGGNSLLASKNITDQIIGLLCMNRPNNSDKLAVEKYDSEWIRVLSEVEKRHSHDPSLVGRLGIVAGLRDRSLGYFERIEKMTIEMSVEKIPFLRDIYNQGKMYAARERLLRVVQNVAHRKGSPFEGEDLDRIHGLPDEALEALCEELSFTDPTDALHAVLNQFPGSSYEQNW